jgi:hypothetical protein
MLRHWWRAETGIFLGLWLLLLAGGQSKFLQDPGTFWHTVVGEKMLTTHQLIYQDTYSFTFAGREWSPHQWLGECLMALLHRVDGLDTLLLATVTILAALYTWVAHRLMQAGLHWSLAAVGVGLTIAASSSHFHIRSHIATIVGMAVTFAYLIDFEAGRKSLRQTWWLVPVYVLWTNLHGGMMGGLGTMGIALAGWCGYRLAGRESPMAGLREVAIFGLLILTCALTMVINPYGLGMPRIWQTIMAGDLPQIIVEHAPLDPGKPDGGIVLAFAAVYVAVLIGTLPRWPRISWLLPLIWLYLSYTRIRHAPLFAVGGALAIADMLPYNRWAVRLARSGSDLFRASGSREWRPAGLLIPAGAVLVAVALQMWRVPVPVIGHGWARLDPSYWPVEVLPVLQRYQGRSADGVPIFNEYLDGGFLIYHTPGFRVFVDDRCELYGDRWLHEYVEAEHHGTKERMRSWERTYPHFDLALARTGSGFDRFFSGSGEWDALSQTATATFYRRKKAAIDQSDRPDVAATSPESRPDRE